MQIYVVQKCTLFYGSPYFGGIKKITSIFSSTSLHFQTQSAQCLFCIYISVCPHVSSFFTSLYILAHMCFLLPFPSRPEIFAACPHMWLSTENVRNAKKRLLSSPQTCFSRSTPKMRKPSPMP